MTALASPPAELSNTSLLDVKKESKSSLYKALVMLFEDMFMNELRAQDEFYADVKSIKSKFFANDPRIDLPYIRTVLKNEFNIVPVPDSIYFNPFVNDPPKTGRPYLIKKTMLNTENLKSPVDELPF